MDRLMRVVDHRVTLQAHRLDVRLFEHEPAPGTMGIVARQTGILHLKRGVNFWVLIDTRVAAVAGLFCRSSRDALGRVACDVVC